MAAAKKEEKKPILPALVVGTINKLEQSIFTPSISMSHLEDISKYEELACFTFENFVPKRSC